MTETEKAYIAGFLDGEGYITIRRQNRRTAKNPHYALVIGFTNTDLSVLQWLREKVGAGSINAKSRKNPKRHSPAWELTIHQKPVKQQLLEAVQPYVKIKTKQVELGLAFLKLGKVKKSMEVIPGKAWPIFRAKPDEIAVRENFKLQLGLLNTRGVTFRQ